MFKLINNLTSMLMLLKTKNIFLVKMFQCLGNDVKNNLRAEKVFNSNEKFEHSS